MNDEDDESDTKGPTVNVPDPVAASVDVSQPADTNTDANSALGNDTDTYTYDALNGEAPGAGAGAGGLGERASAARENKKIDRHSLSFLLEGWEQDGCVKSQTQKSKKDLKLIDIIFDSSRVLSPHAQKYDRR